MEWRQSVRAYIIVYAYTCLGRDGIQRLPKTIAPR